MGQHRLAHAGAIGRADLAGLTEHRPPAGGRCACRHRAPGHCRAAPDEPSLLGFGGERIDVIAAARVGANEARLRPGRMRKTHKPQARCCRFGDRDQSSSMRCCGERLHESVERGLGGKATAFQQLSKPHGASERAATMVEHAPTPLPTVPPCSSVIVCPSQSRGSGPPTSPVGPPRPTSAVDKHRPESLLRFQYVKRKFHYIETNIGSDRGCTKGGNLMQSMMKAVAVALASTALAVASPTFAARSRAFGARSVICVGHVEPWRRAQ